MSKTLCLFTLMLLAGLNASARLTFSGNSYSPVEITPVASSGLTAVYVVNTTSGLSLTYTAASAAAASAVEVGRFDMRGASFSSTVDPSLITRSGNEITISSVDPDAGYIFAEGSKTSYYWIADYSAHPFTIDALSPAPEQECDRTFLETSGSAPRMVYYGITGRSQEIDREITLSYTTLVADNENVSFTSTSTTQNLAYIDGRFGIEPPLCNTYFTLTGDRFLRQWAMEKEIKSSLFTTQSVAAITSAVQQTRQADNEIKVETTLGGSAPAEISFSAATTDAAVFTQWLMATDEEMEDVVFRTSDLNFDYTFTDMGTYYLRFQAADASGKCETFSDLYTVFIGESYLRCPNAFSPGATEGVNDLWKVSYKSITSFDCYIFNRWGEKMTEFHDPSQGWDGRYGGKLVPAGVYYYVIKAKGSDGRNYNLSGDINILNYTN